jgi:hypothetical protein
VVTTHRVTTALSTLTPYPLKTMSRTYVIINDSDVSSVNFDQVCETSVNTLRWSVNEDGSQGTKTFVKYTGAKPRFLYGKETYTHSEILTILATDEWTPSDPPGE